MRLRQRRERKLRCPCNPHRLRAERHKETHSIYGVDSEKLARIHALREEDIGISFQTEDAVKEIAIAS